jgi:DNA-binding GntR family transcriptional regulator
MQVPCILDTALSTSDGTCQLPTPTPARLRPTSSSESAIPRLDLDLPKSLSVIVEERIRDAILNAELSFGQALPEDGLGLSLGVSRTPMREALTRLQMQGLVVIIPKKGTFVFEPSLADVEQLASFRLMLETNAVERCLSIASEAALRDMKTAFAAMVAARQEANRRAYARADTAFHDSFFANCGNTYLANAYRTISGRVAALRAHLSVPREDEQVTSFSEHARMMECFTLREKPALLRLLKQHIMRAASAYAAALQEQSPRT